MMGPVVTVATRKSALALAQTREFARRVEALGAEVRELEIVTSGDRVQDRSLAEIGGKGLFVKEIEEALLDGRARFAVHSMKDLPGSMPASLVIACVPLREDPRDAVVTRDGRALLALAAGARVGTSSLRRLVQIRERRADLEIVPLRGNVDTRLRRCEEGVVAAVVLARAGLARLGLLDRVTETLDPSMCIPAIGQGALAIQCREDDEELRRLFATLNHEESAIAVAAERGVLTAVGGSCVTPVAGYAVREGTEMHLRALLAEPDGSRVRRREVRVPWPATEKDAYGVGERIGAELLRE